MCLSMRPPPDQRWVHTFSTWLVVNTMMRSPAHADQSPSMKLSTPESVTLLLPLSSSFSSSPGGSGKQSFLSPSCLLSSASSSLLFFFFLPLQVRSSEQSMS